jgi:hypothetical protein
MPTIALRLYFILCKGFSISQLSIIKFFIFAYPLLIFKRDEKTFFLRTGKLVQSSALKLPYGIVVALTSDMQQKPDFDHKELKT